MRVDIFDYVLPDALIATEPMQPREAARLLYLPAEAESDEAHIENLPELVQPGDIWVLNNTRVIPAQLAATRPQTDDRAAASIGVTLHKPLENYLQWLCFARPGKRVKEADELQFVPDFKARVLTKQEDGQVLIEFMDAPPMEGETDAQRLRNAQKEWLLAKLRAHGKMPLPPYMHREATKKDNKDYQTIFAKKDGSVAAPTASFHLTQSLMDKMRTAGATFVEVTLHVGGGTFLPVKSEDTSEHVMHSEWCELSKETAEAINQARAAGKRIVAVGTTALRTLESMADPEGTLHAGTKDTRLFITPGYQFRVVDALMTNFHLPRSTLLMLVSAFSGVDRIRAAYKHAIASGYRFFSYGDACFLERAEGAEG